MIRRVLLIIVVLLIGCSDKPTIQRFDVPAASVSIERGAATIVANGAASGSVVTMRTITKGVEEWHRRSSRGLQHGYNVRQRPAELTIAIEVDLWAVQLSPHALGLFDAAGRQRFGYDGLAAWDADGTPLPVTLRGAGHRITLHVDDTRARYPVFIDPEIWVVHQTFSATRSPRQRLWGIGRHARRHDRDRRGWPQQCQWRGSSVHAHDGQLVTSANAAAVGRCLYRACGDECRHRRRLAHHRRIDEPVDDGCGLDVRAGRRCVDGAPAVGAEHDAGRSCRRLGRDPRRRRRGRRSGPLEQRRGGLHVPARRDGRVDARTDAGGVKCHGRPTSSAAASRSMESRWSQGHPSGPAWASRSAAQSMCSRCPAAGPSNRR